MTCHETAAFPGVPGRIPMVAVCTLGRTAPRCDEPAPGARCASGR